MNLLVLCLLTTILNVNNVLGQSYEDLHTPEEPLILKSQGSFYIGGETVQQTRDEMGFFPGNSITVNQMYVRYMEPISTEEKLPIVMVHGAALTGKSWETTPDGRMGWDEYFVRKGHATYVVDQVGRGRSGFNQAKINNVRLKKAEPSELPVAFRFPDEFVRPNFRIGPKPNENFEVTLFPAEYLDELSKQGVPDMRGDVRSVTSNYKALSDLASKLDKALLMGHSQSGTFPMDAALTNSDGIVGIVSVEPGGVRFDLDNEQLKVFTKIPILFIFGDYLDTQTGAGSPNDTPFWQTAYNQSMAFAKTVNENGGNVKMLYLPDTGKGGNSHMLMQDTNNLEIADIIVKWIKENIK
ncbi:hypothetical protein [Allomuricauda sp. ARW1Y1]|uniref:hypothetical protein n=1 Tax=Allomuricauda sp. ARW1Y1 TaxID=2663843 RepID=UPI0015CAE2D3|nr:hypothetical protein [Muricauda sp. ARW1Y1]